jgi:hypothetical protein
MAESIQRDFTMDDLLMLERAQVFHNGFINDKALFEADYPYMADPYAANFQTAIDDADAIPSGAEYDSEIADKTAELNAQLPIGQKALKKLYSYVELAWDSTAKLNRFGKNKYDKSRSSQLKLKELLELAHRQAELPAHKTTLLAVGYTQAAIDNLETIANTIDALNAEQEDMLAARGDKTQARITAYNEVFAYMQQINKASKIVFDGNPAKIDFYLLYPTASQSLPKPQNLQASPNLGDPNVADLTWDTVAGATSYKIYYSEVAEGAPSGTFGEIEEVMGATNTQAPIIASKRNYWKIKAYGGGLSSDYSDEVWIQL